MISIMQAALGPVQLERINELIERKIQIFHWYKKSLENIPGIALNYEAPNTKNTYWMVTAVLEESFGLKKDALITLLAEKGIACRPFFHPLSSIPAYQNSDEAKKASQRNKIAYKISPYGLNLPCGLNMTEEKVRYVCVALKDIVSERGK